MGLFHVKKGTPASKALPNKSTLKDGTTICMDFCCHERKCNFNYLLCKNGKHYTNWKNVPEEDKLVLLKHMDMTGLMWLDAETFEKHKITIAHECVHLLGNATGPKQKATEKRKANVSAEPWINLHDELNPLVSRVRSNI